MIAKSFLRKIFYALIVLGQSSCDNNEGNSPSIETDPIVFTKEAEVYLLEQNGDTLQRLEVEVADIDYERQTGLMYRHSLESNQAMLFVYNDEQPRSFYMKNTYIPLDILYYNMDSTLVSVHKNTTPRDETSLPSNAPAKFVLEINAGLVDEWNISANSRFTISN